MNEEARITVIIPMLDRRATILRALESVAGQDVRPLRIIVSDNGSSDGGPALVSAWIDSHSGGGLEVELIEEPRPGVTHARQTAFELCRSEWVVFFDSDDEMTPGTLRKALDASEGADVVGWRQEFHYLDGRQLIKKYNGGDQLREQTFNGTLCTGLYMVRSEVLREVGGWNRDMRYWEDLELGFRLFLRGAVIRHIPHLGAMIYQQRDSMTGKGVAAHAGEWERSLDAIEREMLEGPLERAGLPSRDKMADLLNYRRVNLAALYSLEGRRDLGEPLLRQALGKIGSRWRRLLARLIYEYSRRGGRGAWRLWR